MDRWHLILFQSLLIKEGHFLWPKHRRTGGGFFVARIHESDLQNYISRFPSGDVDQLAEMLFEDVLKENHLGKSEPLLIEQLDFQDLEDDELLRKAVEHI